MVKRVSGAILIIIVGLFCLVVGSNKTLAAPTILTPNDVVIVSVNTDTGYTAGACVSSPESNGIDLLLRTDIGSGTIIKITDNAWTGSALNATEGYATYTAAADMPAGSIIRYTDCAAQTLGSGWVRTGGFDPATSGDNLFVYQNTEASPSFIYGLATRASSWIAAGVTSAATSYIPTVLSGSTPAAYNTLINSGAGFPRNWQYTVAGNYGIFSSIFLTDLQDTASYWVKTGTSAAAGSQHPQTTVPFDASLPTIPAIVRLNPITNPTNSDTLTFLVTFSEDITGFDLSDIDLQMSGTTAAVTAINQLTPSTYEVVIDTVSGDGTVGIGILSGNGIVDAHLNPYDNQVVSNQNYTIDNTAPSAPNAYGLITADTTPQLSGSWDESNSTSLTVTVNGVDYVLGVDTELTTDGGGNWTLDLTPLAVPLSIGSYEVTAVSGDDAGNTVSDVTTMELEIFELVDLRLTKTLVTTGRILAGNTVTYSIQITNTSSTTAFPTADIQLYDLVPNSLNIPAIVGATFATSNSAVTCGNQGLAETIGSTFWSQYAGTSMVACSFDSSVTFLNPGETVVFSMSFTANIDLPDGLVNRILLFDEQGRDPDSVILNDGAENDEDVYSYTLTSVAQARYTLPPVVKELNTSTGDSNQVLANTGFTGFGKTLAIAAAILFSSIVLLYITDSETRHHMDEKSSNS